MARTRLGKWAVGLFVTSIGLFALLIVAYNTSALEMFGQRTAGGLALWILTAIAVLGTLVTGTISWLRLKDRSALVVAATVFGILATTLLAFGAIPQN
jgi:hypothetical protein